MTMVTHEDIFYMIVKMKRIKSGDGMIRNDMI
jgi:hypothetical protein